MTYANYSSGYALFPIDSNLQSDIESKIRGFARLSPNWSVMGEGDVISKEAIGASIQVFYWLRNKGYESFETQPGLAGEVWLSAIRDNYELEVVVNSDLLCELYQTVSGEEKEDFLELSLKELYVKIKELDLPWNSSESLTRDIMTSEITKRGSQGWPLGLPLMVEYRSSQNHAPLTLVDQSVDTLKDFIAA